MVKNDKKIVQLAREMIEKLENVTSFYDTFRNLCASTDRSIESAVELAKQIEELHKQNFEK